MNSSWQNFLATQTDTKDSGSTAVEPACGLVDLSHLGLIRVSGADTEHFLQGQLSSDVREVTANHFQNSSYCTPKGRMLANFVVFRHGDDLMLQLPAELLPSVIKRLSMFVLMSKVQLTDVSEQLVRIGLAGDCAERLLLRHFGSLPSEPGKQNAAAETTVLRLACPNQPRFELVGAAESMQKLWSVLAAEATRLDAEWWSLLDIRAGIPTIQSGTVEAFVPQMVNLHLLDGVSFTKGCYTGQEVIARMKYLGKLKRRMYLAHAETEREPLPGDEVFSAASESPQGAGKVVDARRSPSGGYDLLAVLEVASAENGDLHLRQASGPELKLRELPYRLGDD